MIRPELARLICVVLAISAASFCVACDDDSGGAEDPVAALTPGTVLVEPSWDWTYATSVPDGIDQFTDVACVSASACVAVAQTDNYTRGLLLRSSDGGGTWTITRSAEDVNFISGLECITEVRCIAWREPHTTAATDARLGLFLETNDAGATWTERAEPEGVVLWWISCPSGDFCMASGSDSSTSTDVLLTSRDAVTWRSGMLPTGVVLRTSENIAHFGKVSCSSEAACWLALNDANSEDHLYFSRDGGQSWEERSPDSFSPAEVVCFDEQRCWVAGFGGLRYTGDAGERWEETSLPTGINLADNIDCARPTDCFITGDWKVPNERGLPTYYQLIMRVDDQRVLRTELNSTDVHRITDLDCLPSYCVAVGNGDAKVLIGRPR